MEPGAPCTWIAHFGDETFLSIVPLYSDRELLMELGVPPGQPRWVTRHPITCLMFLFIQIGSYFWSLVFHLGGPDG
jgi:hypothetical protein